MKVRLEVISLNADGNEQRRQVLTIERHELAMGPIFCCRPGRGSSTRIWTTYSAVGIQNSGRNHKRRSQSGRRLDPRLFGALLFRRVPDFRGCCRCTRLSGVADEALRC